MSIYNEKCTVECKRLAFSSYSSSVHRTILIASGDEREELAAVRDYTSRRFLMKRSLLKTAGRFLRLKLFFTARRTTSSAFSQRHEWHSTRWKSRLGNREPALLCNGALTYDWTCVTFWKLMSSQEKVARDSHPLITFSHAKRKDFYVVAPMTSLNGDSKWNFFNVLMSLRCGKHSEHACFRTR